LLQSSKSVPLYLTSAPVSWFSVQPNNCMLRCSRELALHRSPEWISG